MTFAPLRPQTRLHWPPFAPRSPHSTVALRLAALSEAGSTPPFSRHCPSFSAAFAPFCQVRLCYGWAAARAPLTCCKDL
eukprot:scaffold1239_cov175-Pinguiococcus_pyrenoidosus.AAC.26